MLGLNQAVSRADWSHFLDNLKMSRTQMANSSDFEPHNQVGSSASSQSSVCAAGGSSVQNTQAARHVKETVHCQLITTKDRNIQVNGLPRDIRDARVATQKYLDTILGMIPPRQFLHYVDQGLNHTTLTRKSVLNDWMSTMWEKCEKHVNMCSTSSEYHHSTRCQHSGQKRFATKGCLICCEQPDFQN